MAGTITYNFTCDLCGTEYGRDELTRIYVGSRVPTPSPAEPRYIDMGEIDATVDVCADCAKRPFRDVIKGSEGT